jgi:spermidine dehydrogenase
VVNVSQESDKRVSLTYVQDGQTRQVKAKGAVLACYNMAIPHLCPQLPEPQKTALASLVKTPLVYTNVLLKQWRAFESLGVGMAYSPGRWHKLAMLDFPVSTTGYQFAKNSNDPIMLHMNRSVAGPGATPEAQSRSGRYELLGRTFEMFERDIRGHLAGMLSGGDFDPARDIAAITVNRWPHGYAWSPNSAFHPAYQAGQAPNEIARKPFGRITIANSDAGARAYLDCAIDEAYRAVGELIA